MEQKALIWTKGKPTKTGWYWYRDRHYEAQPVHVNIGSLIGDTIGFFGESEDDSVVLLADLNGVWAGPIAPPEG
jgi:hypothetical protein